ncbi:MAG TPA: WYL domain-containing protein, partial [Longimicrobiaceae bacterium]|nr:WYL domain-containing protein [Longimicrobiaceae bacterium]
NTRRPGTADYEVPDDFDLRDYAGRRAWELGNAPAERAQDGVDEPPVRARVLFRFPTSLWAERNGYGVRGEEEREDGSEVRAFDVWQVDPFVRWILGLAGEAIPLEPPELVDAVREAARRVAVLHGGGAGA